MNFRTYEYPGGHTIKVSSESEKVNPYTWNGKQMYEYESIDIFYSLIRSRNCKNIIDIGAQSGLYSLYAKYLPESFFFAFEPYPDSYKCLNDNIKLNEITNVKTSMIALSDKKGRTMLNVCPENTGLHTLGSNPIRFDINKSNKLEIETDTIDNIFHDISVDSIKCDTEGWELNILKGGIETLKRCKPILQLEYNLTNMKQCSINPKELDDFLISLNYEIYNTTNEERIYI